jgi:hypothetical protein
LQLGIACRTRRRGGRPGWLTLLPGLRWRRPEAELSCKQLQNNGLCGAAIESGLRRPRLLDSGTDGFGPHAASILISCAAVDTADSQWPAFGQESAAERSRRDERGVCPSAGCPRPGWNASGRNDPDSGFRYVESRDVSQPIEPWPTPLARSCHLFSPLRYIELRSTWQRRNTSGPALAVPRSERAPNAEPAASEPPPAGTRHSVPTHEESPRSSTPALSREPQPQSQEEPRPP